MSCVRGHQRSSEVFRGHQRSSEVIGGHQRQSEVNRGHQRSSEVIRGHQRRSEAISIPHDERQLARLHRILAVERFDGHRARLRRRVAHEGTPALPLLARLAR